jgi:hypothetical protein
MKRILIYLLLMLSMTVFAQQQADNEEENPVSDEQSEDLTVTGSESEDDANPVDEDENPLGEDENPEDEDATSIDEDGDGASGETGEVLETDSTEDLTQDDGYLTDDQIENLANEGDEEVIGEEVIGDEVLDADETDILPGEEISEDYPVPLPSDI